MKFDAFSDIQSGKPGSSECESQKQLEAIRSSKKQLEEVRPERWSDEMKK